MKKDAGDDPDITNGLLICAAVEKTEGETILIDGGMGVRLILNLLLRKKWKKSLGG